MKEKRKKRPPAFGPCAFQLPTLSYHFPLVTKWMVSVRKVIWYYLLNFPTLPFSHHTYLPLLGNQAITCVLLQDFPNPIIKIHTHPKNLPTITGT